MFRIYYRRNHLNLTGDGVRQIKMCDQIQETEMHKKSLFTSTSRTAASIIPSTRDLDNVYTSSSPLDDTVPPDWSKTLQKSWHLL